MDLRPTDGWMAQWEQTELGLEVRQKQADSSKGHIHMAVGVTRKQNTWTTKNKNQREFNSVGQEGRAACG